VIRNDASTLVRRPAARLELLDGAADGAADAAFGRLGEAEIAIFQKRPQALACPVRALEPRQHDLGFQIGHASFR
jgi:hypothetical protein